MKQCPQCGHVYGEEYSFCRQDGADLVPVTSPASTPAAGGPARSAATEAPAGITPAASSSPAEYSAPAPRSFPTVAVVAVIALLLGAVLFFLSAQAQRRAAEERRLAQEARIAAENAAARIEKSRASTEESQASQNENQDEPIGDAPDQAATTEEYSSSSLPTHDDETLGFRIGYPAGWRKSIQSYDDGRTRVRFDAPSSGAHFLVDASPTIHETESPIDGWRDMNRRYAKAYKGRYRLIALEEKELLGRPAARWEFVLQEKGEPALRKIDWGLPHYAVLFAAPPAQFEKYRPVFDQVFLTFQIKESQGY